MGPWAQTAEEQGERERERGREGEGERGRGKEREGKRGGNWPEVTFTSHYTFTRFLEF